MKPTLTILGAVGACCALSVAAWTGPVPPAIELPQSQIAALSGIDVRIRKEQIEYAFGASPLNELISVARDPEADPGVRLRAYRAVGLYKSNQARTALNADLVSGLSSPDTGTELLLLRAVIEALGEQQEPADVPTLVAFLDFEESRDIRAAAADALRTIQSTQAIPPLLARLSTETVEQVRQAISRALRALDPQ